MTHQHTVTVPASTCRVVDTTGAGDAFMGAILSRLLKYGWTTAESLAALNGRELQEIGTFANQAAAISCTRYGGITSLPSLMEVEQDRH